MPDIHNAQQQHAWTSSGLSNFCKGLLIRLPVQPANNARSRDACTTVACKTSHQLCHSHWHALSYQQRLNNAVHASPARLVCPHPLTDPKDLGGFKTIRLIQVQNQQSVFFFQPNLSALKESCP